MKDTNGDTNKHKLWLYYTSGTVCTSIIFDQLREHRVFSALTELQMGRLGLGIGRKGLSL